MTCFFVSSQRYSENSNYPLFCAETGTVFCLLFLLPAVYLDALPCFSEWPPVPLPKRLRGAPLCRWSVNDVASAHPADPR